MEDVWGDQVVELVRLQGPHVVERIVCLHCGHDFVAAHPFAESLSCPVCEYRTASRVPVYNDRPFGDFET